MVCGSIGEGEHPGPYIRELLIEHGLTVVDLATVTGIARPNLNNAILGKMPISPNMAYNIDAAIQATLRVEDRSNQFLLAREILRAQADHEWISDVAKRIAILHRVLESVS